MLVIENWCVGRWWWLLVNVGVCWRTVFDWGRWCLLETVGVSWWTLAPVWHRFDTGLAPVWRRFGTGLTPVWRRFGTGLYWRMLVFISEHLCLLEVVGKCWLLVCDGECGVHRVHAWFWHNYKEENQQWPADAKLKSRSWWDALPFPPESWADRWELWYDCSSDNLRARERDREKVYPFRRGRSLCDFVEERSSDSELFRAVMTLPQTDGEADPVFKHLHQ